VAEPCFDLRGEHGDVRRLLADLWASRQLVSVLARKEFLVRYRRASFGVAWVVALPLVQAGVLALVLPKLVRFDTPGSYLVFVFAGTTAWAFFAASVTAGAGSIVEGQSVSTRVYFPRLVFPVVAVLANAFGLVPAVAVLVGMVVLDGEAGVHLLWLVPATALAVVLTGALSSLLAGMQVYFRDVRYLTQAALLALFYATPVIYPLDELDGALRRLIEANPVTGVVELFRAGTVGADSGWGASVAWSIVWTAMLVVATLWVHRRYDRLFVDLL
jgi:ABC-type polysaccharide/polyol phosphate export permease